MKHMLGKNEKGFTLSELLIAIAILVILFALAVPWLLNLQRDLRQKELDSKAEIIFVAAQNQMMSLRSSGYESRYLNATAGFATRLPDQPSDRAAEMDAGGNLVEPSQLYAASSKELVRSESVASYIMTPDSVDYELYDNNWVIEYDPSSGSVYAVFYSETKDQNNPNYSDFTDYGADWYRYDAMRNYDTRKAEGPVFGYYGGDSVESSNTSVLNPSITVVNKETLEARLNCARPVTSTKDLEFTVKLFDNHGHVYETVYRNDIANKLERIGRSYYVSITLDDLSSEDTRFNKLYGPLSNHTSYEKLVPGDILTIELTVSSQDHLIEPKTVRATTNGLFADATNDNLDANRYPDTAVIEYGRHLQNLDALRDEGAGMLNENIKNAALGASIQFGDTLSTDDWHDTYCAEGKSYFNGRSASGEALFKPIVSPMLASFNGNNTTEGGGYTISGLHVEAAADTATADAAGLFSSIESGMSIQNTSLVDARVIGSAATGVLAGTVGGTTTILNCRAYLSNVGNSNQDDIHVSGDRAGGLVGTIASGAKVNISNSLAATVQSGTSYAGGLVGESAGELTMSHSYADSYLHGRGQVAGLLGGGEGTTSIESCYAAGFLYGGTVSGLAGANVASASNSYTICAAMGSSMAYSTAPGIGSVSNVYYLHSGENADGNVEGTTTLAGNTANAILAAVGGADAGFTNDTTNSTHPYNLMGQSLSTYTYPRLLVNDHYGDWEADFRSGALVYYETYDSGSAGFYGADIDSTLSSAGNVLGDGYGVVYRAGDSLPETVEVIIDGIGTYSIRPTETDHHTVEAADGTEYRVYPLPTEALNRTIDSQSEFYWRVQISEVGAGSATNIYYFNPYYAKTARYSQDEQAAAPTLNAGDSIAVRTARHLYSTSLYYDYFVNVTAGCTFDQERDIDYRTYDWNGYFREGSDVISVQEPIGASATSFVANYDGNCNLISGISFVADQADYVGMFGYNEGQLSNIVLSYDFVEDEAHYYIGRRADLLRNQHVYMGVLAGYNSPAGVITNCATAGYTVTGTKGTISAYSNSTLYVGGLVGGNEGMLHNSEADCPSMRLSTLNAQVAVGGFVGVNYGSGSIANCYDLGFVDVAYASGGNVSVAGFAGSNDGTITSSYCATSLVASGSSAQTYAFAPLGGIVDGCDYLSDGTYTYVNHLRSYNNEIDRTSGTLQTRDELCDLRGKDWADSSHVFDCGNTYTDADNGYPYRAVVKDADGRWVHYGDWQGDASLGTMGLFYWEHEEHGSNDGYHLTFIGVSQGDDRMSGTTLCNAHDDGGVVTEYGYGYFALNDEAVRVNPSVDGSLGFSGKNAVNLTAQAELHKQMKQYTFYPYTTRTADEAGEGGDYLYLAADDASKREGVFTLEYGDVSYDFQVAPFFANAISFDGAGEMSGSDGVVSNYGTTPGQADNQYEVRSLQQLQYLNWNAGSQDTEQLVTPSNYQQFPYLQYALTTNASRQSEQNVLAVRPRQYWRQTHDLGVAPDGSFSFTPIAGAATSSAQGSYNAVLYAWFGGDFDGGSYKIQNIDLSSDSFTVGLFGATAGAHMEDIILYSDKDNVIERETNAGSQVGNTIGAYTIGGLIGLAYDYNTSTSQNVISNCAIAGYRIEDHSANKLTNGEANVGGLIGVANVRLQNCSAVVDINLDCSHDAGAPTWGNYIRVGGLTGAAQYTVTDCYSGGRVTVEQHLVDELYNNQNGGKPAKRDVQANRTHNTFVYVAGISGSAFTSNYMNFTGQGNNSTDGHPVFNNCYSFMRLPNIEGTIKAVSYIAGPADRYSNGVTITMNNCHYLGSVNAGVSYTPPEYWFRNKGRTLSEQELDDIHNGNLFILTEIINNDNKGLTVNGIPHNMEYEELSAGASTLGSEWSNVTTTEGGVSIPGKYSFPGNKPALYGMDYPFPTIVKQEDLVNGGTVNVHYGEWPLNGASWDEGLAEMDIFADMVKEGDSAGWAEKTFILNDPKEEMASETITASDFTLDPVGYAEVVDVQRKNSRTYEVKIRALGEGATTVVAAKSGSGASFVLQVTAKLEVKATPDTLRSYKDKTSSLELSARSQKKPTEEYFDKGVWEFDKSDLVDVKPAGSATRLDEDEWKWKVSTNKWAVTHLDYGAPSLHTTFTYDYHGTSYTAQANIAVKTYGVIGISADSALLPENAALYNEVGRQLSETTVTGENATYGQNAPAMPSGVDADFYLYETVDDLQFDGKALDGLKDVSVRVFRTGENAAMVEIAPEDIDVTLGSSFEEDSHFQYWPCHIRYKGEGTLENAVVTVEFTHEEDVAEDSDAATPYSLSIGMNVPRHVLHFEPNGGTGTMKPVKMVGNEVALPDCEFSRVGYLFDKWQVKDEEDHTYLAGETYDYFPEIEVEIETETGTETRTETAKDMTLVALWKPITYKVLFDANDDDATGSMDPQELTYDIEASLKPNEYELGNRGFAGWSTTPDGEAEYADEEVVKNLADEQDEEVTLYATWAETYNLTLHGYDGDSKDYSVTTGYTRTLSDYEPAQRSGFELVGWYTEEEGGDKVLDEDGKIVASVEGYTENGKYVMTENKELYAHWDSVFLVYDGYMLEYSLSTFDSEYEPPVRAENKPDDDLYVLPNGWFTEDSGDGGDMILDALGGLVDGQELEPGQTLYARWEQMPRGDWDPETGEIEGYDPEGEKWSDWVNFDYDAGDTLVVTCDTSDTTVAKQNLISFGRVIGDVWNDGSWDKVKWDDVRGFMVYHPCDNFSQMNMRAHAVYGKGQNYNENKRMDQGPVEIRFSKQDGLIINDYQFLKNRYNEQNYLNLIQLIKDDGGMLVGSTEGANRSYATGYVIQVLGNYKYGWVDD